jgi:hypothetical protein
MVLASGISAAMRSTPLSLRVIRKAAHADGLGPRLIGHGVPKAELTLWPRRAAADPAGLQIRQHGGHHLVRAKPVEQRRSLELRMPVALRAIQPHNRPVDIGQAVGAFGHGPCYRRPIVQTWQHRKARLIGLTRKNAWRPRLRGAVTLAAAHSTIRQIEFLLHDDRQGETAQSWTFS